MATFRKNSTGFVHVGMTLLITVVLVAIGGTGYYVWHRQHRKTSSQPQTSQNRPTAIRTFEACVEAGGTITRTVDPATCVKGGKSYATMSKYSDDPANWSTTGNPTITLAQYGVRMTLPTTAVGKVVYRYAWDGGDTYVFAIKAILTSRCLAYLRQQSDAFMGLQVSRVSMSTDASGQIANAPQGQTLDQYYAQHKASDGNYVIDPSSNAATGTRKYWKIGNYFYVAQTLPRLYQGSGFAAACPQASGAYEQQVADALATLTED